MATFLVTGANRGIGLEYCRQLKARGDEVVPFAVKPVMNWSAWGCGWKPALS